MIIEEENIYSIQKQLSEYEESESEVSSNEKRNKDNIEIKSTIKIPVIFIRTFEDFRHYFEIQYLPNLYKQTKSKSEIINKKLEDNSKESLIKKNNEYEMQIDKLESEKKKLVSENEDLKKIVKQYKEENKILKNSIKEIEEKFDYNNKSNLQFNEEKEILDVGQKSIISEKNKNEQNQEITKKIKQLKNNKNESNLDILLLKRKELEEKLKVKGEEKNFAECFRKKYDLKEENYPDEKIIEALKENNYEIVEAFVSFFSK